MNILGHPVGGGDCGLDVGDGRPVGEVGDPVGTSGHLGAGAAVAGAAEVLVVAVGGGPGAPHGWLHRVGTAPELVAAVLLVLPSLQPPALQPPGRPDPPLAIPKSLADCEAKPHHEGEARVPRVELVLLCSLGSLLGSASGPVHGGTWRTNARMNTL